MYTIDRSIKLIINHVLINESNVIAMFSIHDLLSGGWGSPSSTRNEPNNALEEHQSPAKPKSTRGINTAVDENRAIDANDRRRGRNQRSVANAGSEPTIATTSKPTSRANGPSPRARRNTRSYTKSPMIPIEWRWAYRGQSETTSLVIKKTRPTKGVTYEKNRGTERSQMPDAEDQRVPELERDT